MLHLEYIFVKRNLCKNGHGFCEFSSAITSRLFLCSYAFVKNVHKKRRGCCAFSSAITGGTGEFMYKALILGNKLLLSNMTDHKATQVPNIT